MGKPRREGSALGLTVISTMLLFTLIFSVMTIASGYHARSVMNYSRRQMLLTVRSTAYAIAADLAGQGDAGGASEAIARVIEENREEDGEIDCCLFSEIEVEGLGESMGKCKVSIVYEPEHMILEITVTAEKNRQIESATVVLEYMPEEPEMETGSESFTDGPEREE